MAERALEWSCEDNLVVSVGVGEVTSSRGNRLSKDQSGFGVQKFRFV